VVSFTPLPLCPRVLAPSIHWAGPQSRSGCCVVKKNLLLLPGIETRQDGNQVKVMVIRRIVHKFRVEHIKSTKGRTDYSPINPMLLLPYLRNISLHLSNEQQIYAVHSVQILVEPYILLPATVNILYQGGLKLCDIVTP
jgi:hypothetical protein